MRYFANPSTARVREAMSSGWLGCIVTPRQGNRIPDGATWCADNGCFGDGYPGDVPWLSWLTGLPAHDRCAFAVAPDVVADAAATLDRSEPWLPLIRRMGVPAALVAQNGLEELAVPWQTFDVLFLGGDTDWKLGPAARELAAEAKARGKSVHMGRVNSLKRMRYAKAIGCESADGTIIARAPDRRMPEVLSWLRDVNEQGVLL